MIARSLLRSLLSSTARVQAARPALALVFAGALGFAACAEGASFDDDASEGDAGTDSSVSEAGSTSGATSSSSSGGASSGGASSSSGGGSSSGTPAECGTLVLNEVSGGNEDWVEIFNPGDCDVDLSDFTLLYRAEAGQADLKLFDGGNGTVTAGGYFVIGAADVSGTDSKFVTGTSLSGTSGQLALKKGSASVDEVGYGDANGHFGEGQNAPSPGTTGSIARQPNGTDTQDNSADFAATSSPSQGESND